jgi:hypothetical protein
MKEVPRAEWARRLLEDQIERLGELRNASPRDNAFKLWRQTTLTVIQRIWPGDLIRCERFRRVPFSTPSTKASRAAQKQHFDRGCVEAGQYLKSLIAEIESQGLGSAPRDAAVGPAQLPAELAGAPPSPQVEEPSSPAVDPRDLYEPSPLERIVSSIGKTGPRAEPDPAPEPIEAEPEPLMDPDPPRVEPARRAPESRVPSAPPPQPPPAPPVARAPSAPPAPSASPAPPAPSASPSPQISPPAEPRRTDRRALKEMLGFGDLQQHGGAPSPTPAPPARADQPVVSPPPKRRPEAEDFGPPLPPLTFSQEDIEDFPIDDEQDEAGAEELPELEADEVEVLETNPQPSEDTDPSRDLAIEFLRRSPVLSATAKTPEPVHQPTTPIAVPAPATPPAAAPAMARSPAAAAFAGLAGEVGRLGVPEGQRAAARAALSDMARRIDDGSLGWDSICQILTMAAAYPELARRAVPLVIPFLDVE